jgi:hypothetical protein
MEKAQSNALVKAILWKEELEGNKWENFLCKPNAPKEVPWGYHGGVSSENWLILDMEGMEYLRTKFSELEIGRTMFIASMIGDSDFCFLVNSETGKGHTRGTLRKALEMHRNTFSPFLKKLIDENVIFIVSTFIKRKKVERIMFNPSIARRRDYMYGMTLEPFQDLRNKLGRPLPRKGNLFSTVRLNN